MSDYARPEHCSRLEQDSVIKSDECQISGFLDSCVYNGGGFSSSTDFPGKFAPRSSFIKT